MPKIEAETGKRKKYFIVIMFPTLFLEIRSNPESLIGKKPEKHENYFVNPERVVIKFRTCREFKDGWCRIKQVK